MKQPWLSYMVGETKYNYPVTQINWDFLGNIDSFGYYIKGEGTYLFYRQPDSVTYANTYRNLIATIQFEDNYEERIYDEGEE